MIIAITNQKGGVAKTTSAVNIAAGLAYAGCKVLLVDNDPQGSATISVGLTKGGAGSLYEILTGEKKPQEGIVSVGPLDVIKGDIRQETLSNIEGDRLKNVLNELRGQYHYIIIDNPPSLNTFTASALIAADEVLIPMQAKYLSLDGLAEMVKTISAIQQNYNPDLKLGGIFFTMHQGNLSMTKEIAENVQEHFKAQVFKTVIRNNTDLDKAQGQGQDIFTAYPKSKGASDYAALIKEIVERGNNE